MRLEKNIEYSIKCPKNQSPVPVPVPVPALSVEEEKQPKDPQESQLKDLNPDQDQGQDRGQDHVVNHVLVGDKLIYPCMNPSIRMNRSFWSRFCNNT